MAAAEGELTLQGVLLEAQDEQSRRLKVAEIATVTEFYKNRETADVRPVVLLPGTTSRQVIYEVPVVFPLARWDVQAGEEGLLIVGDLNFRRWWRTAQTLEPEDTSSHALQNAVFLPGVRNSTNSRTIPSDASVLEKPTAGGTVRLGAVNATKAALHEELLPDINTFLSALDTWGAAVGVATGVSWAATTAAIATIVGKIATGSYQSPSVKVED